jgi:AcrR family transcriptional regulator
MPTMTTVRRQADTKGDRTRRRLLDATAAEVARRGIAGASLTDIATATGIRTGSIYFHFESREKLIETMLEEGLRESLRHLDEALAAVDDADAGTRLWIAVEAHLDALVELSDYATVVLTLRDTVDGPGSSTYRKLKQRYGGQWTELIDDAQRAGAIAAEADPRLVRDLLFGAMNASAPHPSRPGREPRDISRALRALLGAPGHQDHRTVAGADKGTP